MLKTNTPWKTLSSKYVYENPWLKVRHDEVMKPDGTKGIYGVIEGRNYNMIIPKIGNQFFLVEQFRYTTSRMSIEFPGGAIEPNETIDAAAARELHEETGLLGGRLTHLGFLHEGNGHENFGFHEYIAEDCIEGNQQLESSEHDMTIKKCSFEEVKQLIQDGKMTDGPSVASFALYLLHEKNFG